jgi:GNAT superfamily N-acetyltransferase
MIQTIDETSLAIINNREVLKEIKKMMGTNNPVDYGIPQFFLDFCINFGKALGCTDKIAFAHQVKLVYLDKRYGKPFRYESKEPLPAAFFDTDDYTIQLFFDGGSVELHIIEVYNRNKGLGTELMNHLLDTADDMGVKIKLIPIAYKSCNTADFLENCFRLKRYYMDFNFVSSKISPYLIYTPK